MNTVPSSNSSFAVEYLAGCSRSASRQNGRRHSGLPWFFCFFFYQEKKKGEITLSLFFFFASPKKKQKKSPEIEYGPISGNSFVQHLYHCNFSIYRLGIMIKKNNAFARWPFRFYLKYPLPIKAQKAIIHFCNPLLHFFFIGPIPMITSFKTWSDICKYSSISFFIPKPIGFILTFSIKNEIWQIN